MSLYDDAPEKANDTLQFTFLLILLEALSTVIYYHHFKEEAGRLMRKNMIEV